MIRRLVNPWPPLAALSPACSCLLVSLMLGGCGSGDGPTPSPPPVSTATDGEGVLGQWVSAGGYQRTYALHLPPSYDNAHSYPLIVMFHGAGGSHQQAQNVGLSQAATAAGFIVAAPDGIGGDWSLPCGGCTYASQIGVDDVAFVATLVRHLEEQLSIDPNGVFVAGISDGGAFTHEVACRYPVAGAAVVAGTMFDSASCHPPRRVPFLGFHGTADSIVAFTYGAASAQQWATMNGCADTPLSTSLADVSADDGTTAVRYDFQACPAHADVAFIAIQGGGHNWPGVPPRDGAGLGSQDVNASVEIVRFFSDHRSR